MRLRRRRSPYSRIQEIRQARGELMVLVLVTVALGTCLSLLASGLYDLLLTLLPDWSYQVGAFVAGWLFTGLLVGLLIWLFHARHETEEVQIEVQIPYYFERDGRPAIVRQTTYWLTRDARRAFARYYRKNSPECKQFIAGWREAKAQKQPFQHYVAADQAQLVECLLLYVLHDYGQNSLGYKAAYGWSKVDLPSRKLSAKELPRALARNRFFRADQRLDQWRLLLPEEVTLERDAAPEGEMGAWRLSHRRFGHLEIRGHRHLAVARDGGQVVRALTWHVDLPDEPELYILATRLEACAYFRLAFLPAADPFHRWAAGLLARLEEGLDFVYFLNTRPGRILANLEWKVGWVPEGTSVIDKLLEVEGRLERLEVYEAGRALDEQALEEGTAAAEEEGEALVV